MDNKKDQIKGQVHALPGIQPRAVINYQAASELQEIVEKILKGEVAGIAWATVNPVGVASHGWNAPTGMGKHLFVGISSMAHRMMDAMNKEM